MNPNWKVGLDIGSAYTAYRESHSRSAAPPTPRGIFFPTVIGYPKKDGPVNGCATSRTYIGREALARFDSLDLVYPLREDDRSRFLSLADFSHCLSQTMSSTRRGKPWGVVSHPVGIDSEGMQVIRGAVNKLFDYVMLVEEPLLMTTALLREHGQACATLVDLGARSTRFYLVSGSSPLENERVMVGFGGDHVDDCLRNALFDRFPDLLLTDETIQQIKEKIGFVAPLDRRCAIELMLNDVTRALDVTEQVSFACEELVEHVLDGIIGVVSRCPSDHVEQFLDNIFLLGGGARMRGLPERIQMELVNRGLDRARVRTVSDPSAVISEGALQWGLAMEREEWEIPLFSYESV